MPRHLYSTIAVLTVYLWSEPFALRRSHVPVESMSSHSQPDAILSAHVTFAALTAHHKAAEPLRLDTLVLRGTRLSLTEAARELASLHKPLTCRGMVLKGLLEVDCRQITDARELEDWRLWVETIAAENAAVIRGAYGLGGEPRIIVDLGSDPIVITAGVFQLWQQEYHLPGIAFGIRDHDPRLLALGADAAVRFWLSAEDRFRGDLDFKPPKR